MTPPDDKLAALEKLIQEQHAAIADLTALVRQLLNPDSRQWFTVQESAALTGVAEWTLRQCCNHGRIAQAHRKKDAAGKWRIHREALDSIREHGLPPTAKAAP